MQDTNKKKSGFTLIETLLYLAIAGSLLLAISLSLAAVLQARVKYQTVSEVEQQGAFAVSVMTQAVRNAQIINQPPAGTGGSLLSLNSSGGAVIFDGSGGSLTETVGSGSAISLLSPDINVTGLIFNNLSRPATPGIVQIQMTLNYNTDSTGEEYNYSSTFYDSASLR